MNVVIGLGDVSVLWCEAKNQHANMMCKRFSDPPLPLLKIFLFQMLVFSRSSHPVFKFS